MNKVWQDDAWEDDNNRLVYRIENGQIEIAQCGSHYRDK
jgi:hypothetical protein